MIGPVEPPDMEGPSGSDDPDPDAVGGDPDASVDEDADGPTEEPPDADTPPPSADACELALPGIAEIVLWLDAARDVAADAQGRVEQWLDQSAHAHVGQATGEPATWPLYVPDALNGHPAVGFGVVGAGPAVRRLLVSDHPSLWFGTGDFAILAVLRHRTSTDPADFDVAYGSIYQKACSECPGFIGPMLFANDFWDPILNGGPFRSSFLFQLASRSDYAARSLVDGFNDDRMHLVVARRTREELRVEVDGMPHATALVTSTLDISNPGVPVAIGSHGSVDIQALEGEIFELVAIRGTTAVDGMADCLMTKYGLR